MDLASTARAPGDTAHKLLVSKLHFSALAQMPLPQRSPQGKAEQKFRGPKH